jgi:hypothetical protein
LFLVLRLVRTTNEVYLAEQSQSYRVISTKDAWSAPAHFKRVDLNPNNSLPRNAIPCSPHVFSLLATIVFPARNIREFPSKWLLLQLNYAGYRTRIGRAGDRARDFPVFFPVRRESCNF